MAIYKQIFPTKWPLLSFGFEIWKLHVYAGLFRPAMDRLAYEYIQLSIHWGSKTILQFNLYETERRVDDRLSGMLIKPADYTLAELRRIKKVCEEEIEKIKKLK